MKKIMAGVIDASGRISSTEVEIEDLKDNEILVKIDACGICGSDLDIFRKDPPISKFWGGHEISGRVMEKGAGAGGPDVGKRVSVMPFIPCGECVQCKEKQENLCSEYSFIGFNRPGGFAEFVAVPDTNVFELPEEMDSDIAVLVEPLAYVFHSTGIAGKMKDKHIVVFGCGTIGLITILLARLEGARSVSAIGRHIHQRDLAKRCGAEMIYKSESPNLVAEIEAKLERKYNAKVDILFETVGGFDATIIAKSMEILRPGGVLVLSDDHYDPARMNLEELSEKEIQVRGTQRYNRTDFENAVDLIKTHGVRIFDLSPIITHRIDLDEIARAYDIVISKEVHRVVKVVVRP